MPHDQVEIILLDKDTQQQIKSYEKMGKTIYLLLTLTFGQETWYVNSHFLTHAVENDGREALCSKKVGNQNKVSLLLLYVSNLKLIL